jgi:hypothetical protein
VALNDIWNALKKTGRELLEEGPEEGISSTNTGIQFSAKEVLGAAINEDAVFIGELKQTLNSIDRRKTIQQIEQYCKTKNPLGFPLVKEQKAIDLLRRSFI